MLSRRWKGKQFDKYPKKSLRPLISVKADSLFSYQPPINLFALCVMLPASHMLSPRWFHKVITLRYICIFQLISAHAQFNVFMIRYIYIYLRQVSSLTASRLTSFPILLAIAWYERQAKITGSSGFFNTMSAVTEKMYDTLPRPLKRLSMCNSTIASSQCIDRFSDSIFRRPRRHGR